MPARHNLTAQTTRQSVSPMATTPLRISSVVVVISTGLRIESLLKSFNDASQFFDPPRGKVSLH
jgi:hypothetical protein